MAEGYIFDMDGVLCDSEAFIAEAAIALFKTRYQVDVAVADFEPFIGTGEDRYLGGVAEKYGINLQLEADKAETYRLYGTCVKGKLEALTGVKAFLARARDEGLRLAVATSADAVKMRTNLREMDLEESLFDALVSGLEIIHKKPAPDIFVEAARRLQLPTSACVVFEDAINGVEAAKSAGAYCVGVTSSFSASALKEAGADQTIETFNDLRELP